MALEEDVFLEDETEDDHPVGKSGIIFLIDAGISMFTKDFTDIKNEEQTRFNIAIKCCRAVMMNKVIAKQKDLVGVVLFRTKNGDQKTKHVTQLLQLNYPNAEAVVKLDTLLNDCESVKMKSSLNSTEDFLLADALWYCSSMFSHSGANLVEKRILLFTDDDNPHAHNSEKAHMTRKRAMDLNQISISLELLSMKSEFDYSLFYKELVEIVNGRSEDTDYIESSSRLGELLERVNRLDFKTRRYAKIKWDLGKGVSVGISLYTLYSETQMLSKEPLNRATNEPVKRLKQSFDQATGELLLPSDIEEYINIAGMELVFTNEDKAAMKKLMDPGITLLGFKPISFISEATHNGQPCFAYPEETLIKGSQLLVKALVDRCIAKQKVALCCLTPRNRAITKYVCLIPSAGDERTPFGFHIIPLPFYNEERTQIFDKSPNIEDKTIELVKQLIKKLKFSYKPNNYKNPKLQLFWTHLEALALEYDAPPSFEDETVVPVEVQTTRLGALAKEFNTVCGLTGVSVTTSKRTSSAISSLSTKRAKTSTSSDNVHESIIDAIKSRKVDKFNVAQLKDFLLSHNKNIKNLKKADLVDAVYNLNL